VQGGWFVSTTAPYLPFSLLMIYRLIKQQSIQGFVQKSPAILPVNKAGIQQHLLAIIAMCDLVSSPFLGVLIALIVGPCTAISLC
jgi:hypothetical protein